nr:O-Methyltransferase [uncultured bacterium]
MTQTKFDVPVSVGLTAFAACSARAVEGSRPDRLMEDPFAVRFIHGAKLDTGLPLSVAEVERESMLSSRFAGVRTRVFDDFLRQAVADGAGQVVILAAGLDARAFRMPWTAGIDVYEVDHPDVLDFKDAVLGDIGAEAPCRRHVVRADLAGDWGSVLDAAGFDPGRKTAWMAEGLLPYLGAREEGDLLRTLGARSLPGSRVCLEYMPPDVVATFRDHPRLEVTSDTLGVPIREMWNAEPREDTAGLLEGLGWRVGFRSLGDCAQALGTPLGDEFATPGDDFTDGMARCGYLTAELTR